MDELPAGIASVLDPLAEAILVTEVQAIAQPLVMVRALIGHDVPLRQPRLVVAGSAPGERRTWQNFQGGKADDEYCTANK